MRINPVIVAVAVVIAMAPASAGAQSPAGREGDWIVRDFRFHTGETLPELRLHFVTIGAPTGVPVLLLHGTGGSAATFTAGRFAAEMFGSGQPLDASRYFIVIPDAIGHGQSSRPSDGLRTRFPAYNYADMVAAQYRLVTEHLGIRHLRLVLGNSMGGMHAWLWAVTYPTFTDAIVPLASEPVAMGGRNWMLRRMVIDAIKSDPEWRGGNYEQQPSAWRTAQVYFNIATNGGARALYRATPTGEQADRELDRRLAQGRSGQDTNDVLYQMQSSRDYDPASALEKVEAVVLAINSADDERNPPELGVMEEGMKRLKRGRYVLLPVTDASRGHGTTGDVTLWKQHLVDLLRQTAPATR